MNHSLINYLDTANEPLIQLPTQIAIFGAGVLSYSAIHYFNSQGCKVVRVYDNSPLKQGKEFAGIPIVQPIPENINDYPVFIASISAPIIRKQITEQLGYHLDEIKHVSLADIYPSFAYLRTNDSNRLLAKKGFEWLLNRIQDPQSLAWLEKFGQCLIEGNYNQFPVAEYPQYLHPKIDFKALNNIADVGAYDGDTAALFYQKNNQMQIIAFEPDTGNKQAFEQRFANLPSNIHFVDKGLWSEETTLYFNSDAVTTGASFNISEQGDISVPVTSLDKYCHDHQIKIEMIKMDIEGAEMAALQGAREQIKLNQPILAICIYHKFEDLWEIPQYIDSLNPDYEFFIGHHTPLFLETVLYAIPKNKCEMLGNG